jgi:transposase
MVAGTNCQGGSGERVLFPLTLRAVIQQSLINLQTAFKNFFEHRAKFPKFKGKHQKQSIRFPESCSIKKGGLKLPKLGIVKASLSKSVGGLHQIYNGIKNQYRQILCLNPL